MSGRDGADAPYWDGLEQGRLLLPRCDGCDDWLWPAGNRCGACGRVGVRWVEQPMVATIFSWTRTWHRFGRTESLELPYTSIVAELNGSGVRLLGQLADPDRIDPVIGEALRGTPDVTIVGDRRIPTIKWERVS